MMMMNKIKESKRAAVICDLCMVLLDSALAARGSRLAVTAVRVGVGVGGRKCDQNESCILVFVTHDHIRVRLAYYCSPLSLSSVIAIAIAVAVLVIAA